MNPRAQIMLQSIETQVTNLLIAFFYVIDFEFLAFHLRTLNLCTSHQCTSSKGVISLTTGSGS